jgi:dihydrofolate reductase
MNRVFIATSLDGFIATSDHGLDWLDSLPNPDGDDYGFASFMDTIDAVVMGRGTFDVIGWFRPWPYATPVFVASSTLTEVPEDLEGVVIPVSGPPKAIVERCVDAGYTELYIDGGRLVTAFVEEGLIDELTISRLPVVLGEGIPLFGRLSAPTWWTHSGTTAFASGIVQSSYRRQQNAGDDNTGSLR